MNDLFSTEELPVIDPAKNYLEEYVGEGKKFKTNEDLAKSKFHADSYIPILERRLDQEREERLALKKEFESRAKTEELINQLIHAQSSTGLKQQQQPATTFLTPSESKVESQQQPQAFDETKLNDLLSTRLTQWDTEKKQTTNVAEVRQKLKERFGSNFQDVLKAKAEELNVSPSFLNNLAKDHPSVLYKTLGLDQQVQPVNMNAPSTSTRFAPTGPEKRTWKFYQEMRKNQRELYDNPRTALQMQRDAIELGDEFKDGDYSRDFDRAFHLS